MLDLRDVAVPSLPPVSPPARISPSHPRWEEELTRKKRTALQPGDSARQETRPTCAPEPRLYGQTQTFETLPRVP
jgi:hypothetical protein